MTWEDGATEAMHQITTNFDLVSWARTPEQAISLFDDQLEELVTNYYNAPLYSRELLASRFTEIGKNVLGAWANETQDTLDSHVSATLRVLADKHACYDTRGITRFGVRGVLVRLADKQARLENLYRKGVRNALFESIEDTWMDSLGYTVIALMLINDTFTLPLKADT